MPDTSEGPEHGSNRNDDRVGRAVTTEKPTLSPGDCAAPGVVVSPRARCRGRARRRPRIVTMELQTTPAKRLAGREAVAAKRCDGLGLIRRWVPLLVRHDDENVRRSHAPRLVSPTIFDAGTERGLSGLWCLASQRHRAGAGRRGAPALGEVPSQTRRPVQVHGLGPRVSDARLAITAVRTSSTRSRAPAEPAPRLNPPRPYLRAALARRPRPDRSGKSRPPGSTKAPESEVHSQAEGSWRVGEVTSAAAAVASADLATNKRWRGKGRRTTSRAAKPNSRFRAAPPESGARVPAGQTATLTATRPDGQTPVWTRHVRELHGCHPGGRVGPHALD